MRILIIEDDPVLSDGLLKSLRGSDFAVDLATDGEQADHTLAVQHYDLVILDLGLPKIDGFEVLRRLRRRGGTAPVLILTARDAIASASRPWSRSIAKAAGIWPTKRPASEKPVWIQTRPRRFA